MPIQKIESDSIVNGTIQQDDLSQELLDLIGTGGGTPTTSAALKTLFGYNYETLGIHRYGLDRGLNVVSNIFDVDNKSGSNLLASPAASGNAFSITSEDFPAGTNYILIHGCGNGGNGGPSYTDDFENMVDGFGGAAGVQYFNIPLVPFSYIGYINGLNITITNQTTANNKGNNIVISPVVSDSSSSTIENIVFVGGDNGTTDSNALINGSQVRAASGGVTTTSIVPFLRPSFSKFNYSIPHVVKQSFTVHQPGINSTSLNNTGPSSVFFQRNIYGNESIPGNGGATLWTWTTTLNDSNNGNSRGYGSGGSGAWFNSSSVSQPSVVGANGVVYIEYLRIY